MLQRVAEELMYQTDWQERLTARDHSSGVTGVSANVWKLGFTSLFTDVSAEMVGSILPLYFIVYLGFSPAAFGVLDGIYQGAAVALFSLVAGIAADRWRRQKEIAVTGYAFSALSRLGLLVLGAGWGLVAGTLVLDRLGKGVRTAPRDALISLSSDPGYLATAFAVHRALDTGGAVIGPMLAFLLLEAVANGYKLVLLTSFFIALIGVGLIALLVEKPRLLTADLRPFPSSQLLQRLWHKRGFKRLMFAGGILALTTASDPFIYLLLQKNTGSPGAALPLFAFVTSAIYMLFSVPLGKLADGWGRRKVFVLGYVLLLAACLILAAPALGRTLQFASLGLLGLYYAATDGVLAALGSAVLLPELRTTGLAMLNTVVSLGKFFSSVTLGLLFTVPGLSTPLWPFVAGLSVALLASAWVMKRMDT
jgi:MFS family permease